LFYDPLVLPKINQGILDYMQRHRLERVGEITGALQLNSARNTLGCGC
jgi:dihydroorotate dehydrogenase (NAD+) catalytic subunit